MSVTPNVKKQKQALDATRLLLQHWNQTEVSIGDPLPPALADAAAVLNVVHPLDLLRLLKSNTATLSGYLR